MTRVLPAAVFAIICATMTTPVLAQSGSGTSGSGPQMTPPPVSKQPGVPDLSRQAPPEGRDSTSTSEGGPALSNPPSLPGERPGVDAARESGRMPAGR